MAHLHNLCTPYTFYIGESREPFSEDFDNEKSTPCVTPINIKNELRYPSSSTIRTTEIRNSNLELLNKKRKRDIVMDAQVQEVDFISMDSRKSPKYNDTSSKLRYTGDECVTRVDLTVFNWNKIMYDKYNRGLNNIKNIQSHKWIKRNSSKLGMVVNSDLSESFRVELIDLMINHIIGDSLCDEKDYLRNHMTEKYTIFDILHFKILKCEKEDICVSNGTKCLCRYYHENDPKEDDPKEDDINCLMNIIFYDTFRRHKCNKLKCKKTKCYFYHDTYNPSNNKINKKIIALLIFIYDNRDRYTNLIKLIKEKLIHLVKTDYIYIINNIGDERKKFFIFIGLNVKSSSNIKEQYSIKKPIAKMRERRDSGSAPVSPIRNRKERVALLREPRRPRALSFGESGGESGSRWGHSMWKKYPPNTDPDRMKLAKSFGPKPKNASEFAEANLLVAYKNTNDPNDRILISKKKIPEDDELIPLNTYLLVPLELQIFNSDDTVHLPDDYTYNITDSEMNEKEHFSFFSMNTLTDKI
jgi:hypothetical protein